MNPNKLKLLNLLMLTLALLLAASVFFSVLILVAIGLGVALYFIPAAISYLRRHTRQKLILLLNITTGWTILGWIVLLIWALKGKSTVRWVQVYEGQGSVVPDHQLSEPTV